MKYSLLKVSETLNIEYLDLDYEGYKFKNKKQTITFFDENMIHSLIINKYKKKIDQLYQIVLNVVNDDDEDEGDFLIVMDDLDRLKMEADYVLKKHMKAEEYKKYIDQLYFLSNMLNEKLMMINYYNSVSYSEARGRGR